jgi:hypothetical protein
LEGEAKIEGGSDAMSDPHQLLEQAEQQWIVTCRCGITFDLRTAPWCHHQPITTKLCPRGHCICHKLKDNVWRPATPTEQALGFGFMLREQFGGKKEVPVP